MRSLDVNESDCVVGISASGRTPFVLGAVALARDVGAVTIGVAGNVGSALALVVDYAIEVPVGPEVIAGSTRMNAGTAQKIVLNVISTAAMVRLGKTYGSLMIDVRPTNEKLRLRALRIVCEITHASAAQATEALEAANWQTKVTCVMLVGRIDAATAREQLASHDGRLRDTFASLRGGGESKSSRVSGDRIHRRLGVAGALVGGRVVPGDVAVRDGEIVAVGLPRPGDGIAIAGLVDGQINGFAGVDILNASVDELIAMGVALLADGVVAYQPTLITSEIGQVEGAARRLAEARRRGVGSRVVGVQLEGPFLSRARAGTHPVEHLRAPDLELLDRMLSFEGVTMVTLAPELPGALELIERCRRRGVTVALGHSAASAREAHMGFAAGASAVTHLFNAMDPMSARAPGLAGAALSRGDVTIQLIADGVHVADELLLLAFSAAPGRCLLVSDMIAAAGHSESTVSLGEVLVKVEGGIARQSDGTIAGSVGKLRDGLRRLGSLGVDPDGALSAASFRPAKFLGDRQVMEFGAGSPANLFVVNDELEIVRRVINGRDVEMREN